MKTSVFKIIIAVLIVLIGASTAEAKSRKKSGRRTATASSLLKPGKIYQLHCGDDYWNDWIYFMVKNGEITAPEWRDEPCHRVTGSWTAATGELTINVPEGCSSTTRFVGKVVRDGSTLKMIGIEYAYGDSGKITEYIADYEITVWAP